MHLVHHPITNCVPKLSRICGTFWVQAIVPLSSPKFLTGTLRGTMACTQHIPYHNGFHDLHNGHVSLQNGHEDFWTWWLGHTETPEDLFVVHWNGSKKRQKRSHENHNVPEKVPPRVHSASYWAFNGKADRPRPEGKLQRAECPLGSTFNGIKGFLRENSPKNSALIFLITSTSFKIGSLFLSQKVHILLQFKKPEKCA